MFGTKQFRVALSAAMLAAPASAQSPEPFAAFQDCDGCPEMVALPPGAFQMGAAKADYAVPFAEASIPAELPRREVTIGCAFAIGKYEVTAGEFAAYVAATGADVGGACWIRTPDQGPEKGRFVGERIDQPSAQPYGPTVAQIADGSPAQPGLESTDRHPAACVTRDEAEAYLAWVSEQSGRRYRLATEAEWEYATRAGAETPFFWGADSSEACRYANFADSKSVYQAWVAAPCAEAIEPLWAAPAGSYEPNAWGLHDTVGSLQEMLLDCWSENCDGAPTDGSPRLDDGCETFIARGGDFELPFSSMRSGERLFYGLAEGEWDRSNVLGFRAAVSLDAAAWDAE